MKLNFLEGGLSLNETKTSSLIITYLIAFFMASFCVIRRGDIPPNLLTLLITLIGIIGGVNAVSKYTENRKEGGK